MVKNVQDIAALVGIILGCLVAIGVGFYAVGWYRRKKQRERVSRVLLRSLTFLRSPVVQVLAPCFAAFGIEF